MTHGYLQKPNNMHNCDFIYLQACPRISRLTNATVYSLGVLTSLVGDVVVWRGPPESLAAAS